MTEKNIKFTEDDLYACWPAYTIYFLEVLNGEYELKAAIEDLKGLVGSKYDPRVCDESKSL